MLVGRGWHGISYMRTDGLPSRYRGQTGRLLYRLVNGGINISMHTKHAGNVSIFPAARRVLSWLTRAGPVILAYRNLLSTVYYP